MADEAKLTVELVDRSGATSTPAPGVAPSTNVPGSDLASQFQQQASGIGVKSAGQGSVPAGAPPVSTAVPPPSEPATTPSIGDFISSPDKGDKGSAQEILTPDEAKELFDKLGLKPEQIGAVVVPPSAPTQTPSQPQPAQAPQQSSSQLPEGPLNYYFNTTPAQRDVEQMFGETDANRAREAQTALQQAHAHRLEQAGKREEANVKAPEYSLPPWLQKMDPADAATNAAMRNATNVAQGEVAATANMAAQGLTRNLGSLAAGSIGGPMGSAVGMAANYAAPMIGEAASFSAMAPALAAAVPAIGAVAATATLAYAATQAVNAQVDDAYRRIRDLNPDVALADARNELRQLRADFQSSARLGDEVANITTARNQFSVQLQGLKDRIVEGPADIIGIGTKIAALNLKQTNQAFDAIDRFLGGSDRYNRVIDKLNQWLDMMLGKEDETMSSFDWFDHQPHLEPPPPFVADGWTEAGDAKEAEFNDIPGLRF